MPIKTLPRMPALDAVVGHVLSVSREEYERREAAYKKAAPHKRGRLNGEPYGTVAPVVKQDHALKKSTSKQRLMRLVTGPELDAHKTTVLNYPEGDYSDVPEVNIERLFSADSAAVLLVDQWQLKLLRKLFIDAAIRGASVNQGLHQLSRRLCKGSREVLLLSGRIGMKKIGIETDFNSRGWTLHYESITARNELGRIRTRHWCRKRETAIRYWHRHSDSNSSTVAKQNRCWQGETWGSNLSDQIRTAPKPSRRLVCRFIQSVPRSNEVGTLENDKFP